MTSPHRDVRCCAHARRRMKRTRSSADEVCALAEHPGRPRRSYAGRVERAGHAADELRVQVVLGADEGILVVRVVVDPFR